MINRVRIAFQITFLSELVDGLTLQVKVQFSTFDFSHSEKDMTWLALEPSKSDFKVWMKFISHISNARSILSHTLSLWRYPYLAVISEIKTRQFDIPNKGWVDELVVFLKYLDFLNLLLASKLEFVVDGSFYPTKSHLISVVQFTSTGRQLVAKATFITSLVEEF